MRRRRADTPVEPFRERQVAWEGQGVTNRPAEIWEPLLAIADAAGGHWPGTACRHFVLNAGPQITSTGVRSSPISGIFSLRLVRT